ncbi:uncharacterized protein LOC135111765 [Scylla paramamosain]|uniref:uncharacterized protein LOC135111765 n=1 Tax=Scylla paramamosain TaxID=85552 RepID=UPI003083E048
MGTDAPPNLAVPDAGRPSPCASHSKKVVKRKPSEAGRSVPARGAECVVEVLTELGSGGRSQAAKEARLAGAKRSGANRADRLQVRLSTLEAEVGRLQHRGRQLDHHLSRVLAQGSLLTSTIDDFHLRLDALARSHKALSRAAQQNPKPSERYGVKSQ